jgi:hypothetical protein
MNRKWFFYFFSIFNLGWSLLKSYKLLKLYEINLSLNDNRLIWEKKIDLK